MILKNEDIIENKNVSYKLMRYLEVTRPIDKRIPAYESGGEVINFSKHRINKALAAVTLPLICVYKNPADYPDKYVARLWDVKRPSAKPTDMVVLADTLEEVRSIKPEWMAITPRQEADDPVIIETWI